MSSRISSPSTMTHRIQDLSNTIQRHKGTSVTQAKMTSLRVWKRAILARPDLQIFHSNCQWKGRLCAKRRINVRRETRRFVWPSVETREYRGRRITDRQTDVSRLATSVHYADSAWFNSALLNVLSWCKINAKEKYKIAFLRTFPFIPLISFRLGSQTILVCQDGDTSINMLSALAFHVWWGQWHFIV